tara:strand:- start:2463 stop:2684 length:222 start_codon:yes stop_codon:yes gene_type:complete
MITNSAKIARSLMTLIGKGNVCFNDRIRDGRSIKVRGWQREHYDLAIQAHDQTEYCRQACDRAYYQQVLCHRW